MSDRRAAQATWRESLRQRRHAWRLQRSGLLDAAWYLARHPEVEAAGIDPALDYLRRGGSGRDPGPAFNGALYLATNRDVAAAGLNPLLHYLLDGWAEGRPLRPGPHEPPRLPLTAVFGMRELLAAALRQIRPRRRVLRPPAGPDPALTIRIKPSRGAMPTGWCMISSPDRAATLLVVSGGVTRRLDIPAGRPAMARLPDVPAQLALQRDPSEASAARPTIVVREIGRLAALAHAHRPPAATQDASSYRQWVWLYDTPSDAQRCAMAQRADRLVAGPRFAVLPGRPALPAQRARMAASLANQLYDRWTMPDLGDPIDADFLAIIDPEARLAPHALLLAAEAIAADPGIDLVYADEDTFIGGEREAPWFKPDACLERLRCQDFFAVFGIIRAGLLRDPHALPYMLAGRRLTGRHSKPEPEMSVIWSWIASQGARAHGRVHHIAHVLAHAGRRTSPEYLQPRAISERNWPTITAIVPTRDQARALNTCLQGLLEGTDYPALDIVVVDNGSTEAATQTVLDRARRRGVLVQSCPGPFNFADLNNRAAANARGELLLFINNDVSISDRTWLKRMAHLASLPNVGAVGAKLLFPGGTLQHGGVVLGMGGVAGHVHLGAAAGDAGYFGRLAMTQEVSAVTAACMLMPARHFAAMGGFDAARLPVSFNDVDLCLKLRQAGSRILWTPDAVLYHHESKSRGSDVSPQRLARFSAEIDTMQRRWSRALLSDPFFSPNLSLEGTDAAYAFPPRLSRPWDPPAINPPV